MGVMRRSVMLPWIHMMQREAYCWSLIYCENNSNARISGTVIFSSLYADTKRYVCNESLTFNDFFFSDIILVQFMSLHGMQVIKGRNIPQL